MKPKNKYRQARISQQQSVQIIAGELRHRKIDFIDTEDLRPTGARIRETLFNWLQFEIIGSRCLDLFAGSGILGFEALSRGASHVTFVEKHPQVAKQLRHNIEALQCTNSKVLNKDFSIALCEQYDVIFLDPPYALRLLPQLLTSIQLLSPKWIFIEDNQPFDKWIKTKSDYEIVKSKKAGNIYYGLLRPITA